MVKGLFGPLAPGLKPLVCAFCLRAGQCRPQCGSPVLLALRVADYAPLMFCACGSLAWVLPLCLCWVLIMTGQFEWYLPTYPFSAPISAQKPAGAAQTYLPTLLPRMVPVTHKYRARQSDLPRARARAVGPVGLRAPPQPPGSRCTTCEAYPRATKQKPALLKLHGIVCVLAQLSPLVVVTTSDRGCRG
eukprot:COSAG04_NODE_11194_length_724_cov_1.249600_1_plen_189_part_00